MVGALLTLITPSITNPPFLYVHRPWSSDRGPFLFRSPMIRLLIQLVILNDLRLFLKYSDHLPALFNPKMN